MKERTIFKSYLFLTKEEENDMRKYAVEYLNEDREDDEKLNVDDYEVSERVYDDLNMFYDDEQHNLNKLLPNNIIALGEVGVWTGQHRGGKVLGNNLNDILYTGNCDDISVTYDRYNVHAILSHHDGRHYMTYRMVKEGYDANDLLDKYVYEGKDIMRYTTSLVPYIKKIYG